MPVTKDEVVDAYKRVRDFAASAEFQGVLRDLNDVAPENRAEFVMSVLLDPEELNERGVNIPGDLVIQRTVFEDGRPTLFCITKYLSDGVTKVTITFDNPSPQ